ncbi:hypothetical protein B7494_g1132 [Chlorociboria aeruginascens]|nr:hypothetical protein B7494_g1132 [Chlorociboria aeruginascens]
MFAIKDFISLLILGAAVSAHVTLLDPIALGIHDPSVTNMNDPIISAAFGGPSAWSFPCKGFETYLDDPTKGAAVATWAAGSQQSFTLGSAAAATSGGAGAAPHNGGSCQISLSYDKGKTFTVIHSYIDNCPIVSVANPPELYGVIPPFTFTVPADAPATGNDGTLFAWTWIAKITNMEVYSNCASVKITAGSGSTPAVAFADRPSLFVADLNTGCINVPGTSVVYPNPGPDTTPAQVTANSASYQDRSPIHRLPFQYFAYQISSRIGTAIMLDTFARLLSSIPTFLFPVFASYKALKTSDPALLTPWLMYWVVLACALLFESWAGFILVWIPFYAWIRLGFLLYLILPQTQGAKVLYQTHVHPFLHENEIAIDDFISSAHDRAKAAGITYLKRVIEFAKERVLGLPPKEPTPPSPPSNLSYTQSLIARFNLPSARPAFPTNPISGASSTATDFYALLASAVSAATSTNATVSPSTQARDLSNSGTLIPPSVHGEERMTFISAQRERLAILLSALDKEASTLQHGGVPKSPASSRSLANMFLDGSSSSEEEAERPKSAMSGLSTWKSEVDFEKIDAESGTEEAENEKRAAKRSTSGGWLPWSWGAKSEETTVADSVMTGMKGMKGDDTAKSSGVDV